MSKILVAITSANNIDLTIDCLESLKSSLVDYIPYIFDDNSTDPIEDYCLKNKILFYKNDKPKGLTSLWNAAVSYWLDSDFDYLLLTNNDVLFNKYSLLSLRVCLEKNNLILCGPLTNKPGNCQHQLFKNSDNIDDIEKISTCLIADNQLKCLKSKPVNGFCFLLSRDVIPYKNTVDCLFPPHFINVGNDDWLNNTLLEYEPNRVGIALGSFVYHYKAKTTRFCKDGNRDNLFRENSYPKIIKKYKDTTPTILCSSDRAMGLGDGVMLFSTLSDLCEKYYVKIICSQQSYNIVSKFNLPNTIVLNTDTQALFYQNDYYKSYNLIYWDVQNKLRQFPHQAINLIRLNAELPIIEKKDKKELPKLPIDPKIYSKVEKFINSLPRPIIITNPFMSYWNKMLDPNKYINIVNELMKLGTVIQIGGSLPKHMVHPKCINFTNDTSIEQSLALISLSDLVVCCDSFVQHATASLKTPAVVMYCGTSPEDFGYPYFSNIWYPDICFCQTKCGRPSRWIYDYEYVNNQWGSRNENGWICPNKLCERLIKVEDVINAAKYELSLGKNRDWSFYDYRYEKNN